MKLVKCHIGGTSSLANELLTVFVQVSKQSTMDKIQFQIGDSIPPLRTKFICIYEKDTDDHNIEVTDHTIKQWADGSEKRDLFAVYIRE